MYSPWHDKTSLPDHDMNFIISRLKLSCQFWQHPGLNNYSTCHERNWIVLTDGSFGTVHGSGPSEFGLGPPNACVKRLRAALIHHCGGVGKDNIEGLAPHIQLPPPRYMREILEVKYWFWSITSYLKRFSCFINSGWTFNTYFLPLFILRLAAIIHK